MPRPFVHVQTTVFRRRCNTYRARSKCVRLPNRFTVASGWFRPDGGASHDRSCDAPVAMQILDVLFHQHALLFRGGVLVQHRLHPQLRVARSSGAGTHTKTAPLLQIIQKLVARHVDLPVEAMDPGYWPARGLCSEETSCRSSRWPVRRSLRCTGRTRPTPPGFDAWDPDDDPH